VTTAGNVRVGGTGAVYGAPAGTTLPTTVDGALNAAFDELGYLDESGIVQAINSDVTDIQAWQNGDIVRKVQTSHDLTYAMTFLETSALVLEAFYGNYDAGDVEIKGEQGVRQCWALQVIDGNTAIRIVIPDGQITERGEVSYVNGDAVSYPVTITCYPDSTGVKAYMYTDLDAAS
jgi:hypothetical protein